MERGSEFDSPTSEKIGSAEDGASEKKSLYRRGLLFSKVAEIIAKLLTKEFKVEGKENIPPGPSLVIAHHDSHFDGHALAAALSGNSIGVVGYASNWLFDWLGMRKVKQVSSQLSAEDRETLRELPNETGETIKRQENPRTKWDDKRENLEAVNVIVNDIIAGKKMIYFPEGAFYEKGNEKLRQPTDGIKIIARVYKKRTGKDLPILPAAIEGSADVFGSDPAKVETATGVMKTIKGKGAAVTVRFGPTFTVDREDDSAEIFQERVGSLISK